jgi:hypothetical protein
MSNQAFEKRVITLTLYSRSSWDFEDLLDIAHALENKVDSGVVGDWEETDYKLITGRAMVGAIKHYGQKPEDFDLDEEGNDLKNEEDQEELPHE